ncbi:hypothetical protein R4Z09_14400 [Niallia oryzisoli]|uniref:Uncharacterized protein n=1 Tax=Niallia oryzisoli TaxID=1737571 RepID=A0ABZ2CJV8_9BACI
MEEKKPNFHKESINSPDQEQAFNVFLNEYLVAEVRGNDPIHLTVIPMRELNDYEENKLHEYIQTVFSNEEY